MALFDDELRRLQQIKAQNDAMAAAEAAQQNYNTQMAQAQGALAQTQNKSFNPLESVLGGIANSVANVGKTLIDIPGTTFANWADLIQGKKQDAEDSNTQQWKKSLYGGENAKDRYMKAGGTALDAAATLSDLIPVAGGASKIGKLVGGAGGQIAQGAISGAAQNLIDNGADASLEDTLRGAASGAAGAGVGRLVGGKLAKAAGGDGLMSSVARNNIARGALTGAASGAAGATTSSALRGGDLGQNLQAALQGAGTGALGGATMAGVMGLAGTGIDKLRNKTASQADVEVPEQAETPQATKKTNVLGRALKNMGNELESAQTDITRPERRKFGIENAGETVNNLRKRTGFSSLQDQAEFAKNITGGQDSVMDTIQKYNISVDADGKPIKLRADQYEVAINDAVGKDWKKSVMGESYDQFREDLVSDIINEDPITAANWLKREAATQRGIADAKGPTADKAARKAKIYTEVANKIDELSYSAVPEKNVNRMFDDTIEEFYTRAREAEAAGNKKYATAYESLAKELENTPRTIADYRTFKKDFVKSSQLADISAGAQSGSLQAGLKKGTNILNKMVNTLLDEPTDRLMAYAGGKLNDLGDAINNAGTSGIGDAIGNVAGKIGGAAGALNNSTLYNTALGDIANRQLARQAGLSAAGTQENQAKQQDAQQQVQNIQNDYDNAMTQAQQAYTNAQAMAPTTDAGTSRLDQITRAMDLALAAGDLDSYSKLASLYQTAYKIYAPVAETANPASSLNATQQGNLAKLESAGTAINQLEQLYNQAGGAQGRLGGSLAQFGGALGINSGASAYENAARGLINQIAAAVGKTDSLNTEGEVQRALDLVPKITDTPEEAQAKLQSLRSMLNANKQTYQSIYGVAQ